MTHQIRPNVYLMSALATENLLPSGLRVIHYAWFEYQVTGQSANFVLKLGEHATEDAIQWHPILSGSLPLWFTGLT